MQDTDVVYTWVNGSDEAFAESRRRCLIKHGFALAPEASGGHRFRDNEELRYSLRSLDAYAPWIRRVYIVTNGQVPRWLDTENERVRIVTHDKLFSNSDDLPTFNSNAIELQLHKIPGLSDRFLYFNDDCFLGRPISLSDFITPAGGIRVYLEATRVPSYSPLLPVHDKAYCNTKKIASEFSGGQRLTYLPAHSPQLYDRAILGELNKRFDLHYRKTSGHQFRDENDMVLRILYFSYLLFSEDQQFNGHQAKLFQYGTDSFSFIMMVERPLKIWRAFFSLFIHGSKFFCVNDDLSGGPIDLLILKSFRLFLQSYFPDPSSFEIGSNPSKKVPG
ncbi:MAG: Stealth CR1 domain-containing protein [Methanothrix sp.]|nr:Stealth CR1 domain-containing protein [Methanothrix sp.]MDD4447762.1 Stealth CR1 domain-containing protein [Methanothrix sp.]